MERSAPNKRQVPSHGSHDCCRRVLNSQAAPSQLQGPTPTLEDMRLATARVNLVIMSDISHTQISANGPQIQASGTPHSARNPTPHQQQQQQKSQQPHNHREGNDDDSDHSSSQLSVHKALTCPEGQSGRVLKHSLFGELLASCRKHLSRFPVQASCHL